MIWGSQYDAMINWMARTGTKILQSTFENKTRNATRITGMENNGEESTDVINNVYDLLGNSREWTLEG